MPAEPPHDDDGTREDERRATLLRDLQAELASAIDAPPLSVDTELVDLEKDAARAASVADGSQAPPLPTEYPKRSRRSVTLRLVLLLISAATLYLFLPTLTELIRTGPEVISLSRPWLLAAVSFQIASFCCLWELQRIALRTKARFPVVTSQLAANAFSRVVPGGAAAGAAIQFRMLTRAGIEVPTAASAMTASSLLSTATVFLLPILALPAIASGTPVSSGIVEVAIVGGVLCVVMIGVGSLLMWKDAPWRTIATWTARFRAWRRGSTSPPEVIARRLLRERDLVRGALGRKIWLASLVAVGRSLFDFLSLLAAARATGAEPNASLVLFAYVAASVLSMIPLTPGGLGFVEAGLTALLGTTGLTAGQAVLAALAYRLISYWIPMLAGAIASLLFRRRYRRVPA